MCVHYGVSEKAVSWHISQGKTPAEAVLATLNPNRRRNKVSVTNENGTSCETLKEFAVAKGIRYKSLENQLKNGMTPIDAARFVKERDQKNFVGPDGITYEKRWKRREKRIPKRKNCIVQITAPKQSASGFSYARLSSSPNRACQIFGHILDSTNLESEDSASRTD